MITLEEYLQNPCGTLSVPYWKWIQMELPKSVKIIHHRDICTEDTAQMERYFRLKHDLNVIPDAVNSRYEIVTAVEADFEEICHVINRSYSDITMTRSRLKQLTKTATYDPDLWILVKERSTGKIAGCAIGDLDRNCREGVLEWIQVLPEYRRQGVGSMMVTHLLRRMAGKADFATVSGQCDNESATEVLYRKCGFTGNDVWYIKR